MIARHMRYVLTLVSYGVKVYGCSRLGLPTQCYTLNDVNLVSHGGIGLMAILASYWIWLDDVNPYITCGNGLRMAMLASYGILA